MGVREPRFHCNCNNNYYYRYHHDHRHYYHHHHHHLALRPVFGSQPPRCRGLEAVEFVRGADVRPTPNPNVEGQCIFCCPAQRSKPVRQLSYRQHSFQFTDVFKLRDPTEYAFHNVEIPSKATQYDWDKKCRGLKSYWKVTAREDQNQFFSKTYIHTYIHIFICS
jgi:hypothetical protein